ncbi:MAG: metallophosphoesterase [Bacillus sp. (in: firmicutes)]
MLVVLIIVFMGGMSLLLYMWRLAMSNRVVEHHLQFEEFPESFGTVTIFFISDIHKRQISNKIINEVKGKAELVIIGGDLAEEGVSFSKIEENIKKLKTIGPVYFVWGNNDYELDYHQLDATLLDLGVKILDNTAAIFESEEGEKISLLGVDYLEGNRARLDLAVLDSEENSFKILVSHCPRIMNRMKDEYNISLILSGHTHGGQIRIFGMGPYEKGGIFKKHNNTLLVSNGYGTTLVPLRLGTVSETHLLHLSTAVSR